MTWFLMPRRLFPLIGTIAAAALLGLSGCSPVPSAPPPAFQGSDVSGVALTDFTLTDHTGQPRKLSDYRGKAVVLYFGYTHCPDVCPTTLAELAQAGFDPVFGARPLKRAIQQQIENPLAKAILEGRFAAGDTIAVSCVGGVMRFEKA